MFRFTRHGFREMLIGTLALMLAGAALGWMLWPLALAVLPLLIWLFAFFRDPEREMPVEQHAVVSPADGTVSDITEIANEDRLNGPCVRVGIFLSVFNVHVNRSPCDGRVIDVTYKKGTFINAMRHDDASSDNESNTIVLAEPRGDRPAVVVKQIVGLIARRIVCTARVGDKVARGQRIGMIKFGSRTELYIAKWLDPQIKVSVGQIVR
ncbi:MAG: phosphatidylserine decarboxylase, partial [Tepidisphaeraceae bacterium]